MAALALSSIRIDGGTQSRVEMNQATVDEYAAALADGAEFPAVIVFFDGASYWLADGFHRYWAARKNKCATIEADAREGTQWDAVLFSVGANSGLDRSDEDKRKCVSMLLDSGRDEWLIASNEKIGRQCRISSHAAKKYKDEWASLHDAEIPAVRTVTRNGKTYQQDTSNIGKRKPEAKQASDETAVPAPKPEPEAQPEHNERREIGPPSNGWQFVRIAIMKLEEIQEDDAERKEALEYLAEWIKGQLNEA